MNLTDDEGINIIARAFREYANTAPNYPDPDYFTAAAREAYTALQNAVIQQGPLPKPPTRIKTDNKCRFCDNPGFFVEVDPYDFASNSPIRSEGFMCPTHYAIRVNDAFQHMMSRLHHVENAADPRNFDKGTAWGGTR